MSIIIREEIFENLGNCLYISNDIFEMKVTLDIGPRIISYNLKGKKNVLYIDKNDDINACGEKFEEFFGKGQMWHLYGGHRIWASPEKFPDTYYPDNEKVDYVTNENSVTFSAKVEKTSGFQKSITISFNENTSDVEVTNTIKNCSDTVKSASVWAICAVAQGAECMINMLSPEKELVPNRSIALWPYTNISDPRLRITDKSIKVYQDKNADGALKIGTNNLSGMCCAQVYGQVFSKQYKVFDGQNYPDYNCSCEIYTLKDYSEIETLSPIYEIKPQNSVSHTEKWSLY